MVNKKDIPVEVTQTLRGRVTLKDVLVWEDGSKNPILSYTYGTTYMTLTELLNALHKMVESDNPFIDIDDRQKDLILMSVGGIDTWFYFNLKVEEA